MRYIRVLTLYPTKTAFYRRGGKFSIKPTIGSQLKAEMSRCMTSALLEFLNVFVFVATQNLRGIRRATVVEANSVSDHRLKTVKLSQ